MRGAVLINGKPTSVSAIVKNGDVISHTSHRHEPPVTTQPISILHEDDGLIVINKPAGLPVHPAGRYNYNSLVEIMKAERGPAWNALPCNRLDRLTSGIMIIGKHPQAAKQISRQIANRNVVKEYVARVKGEFPEEEVECSQPMILISPKLGLNRVRANGKEAKTIFKRLAYYPAESSHGEQSSNNREMAGSDMSCLEDGSVTKEHSRKKDGYSIVRCLPITGRTHQIRVHLQFLGHPISNDPIYCNQRVFGPNLGYRDDSGAADEDIISRLSRMGKDEVAEAVAYHEEVVNEFNRANAEKMNGEFCDICNTPLYSDPGMHELGIYLHAKRYACTNGTWEFETPLPDWAAPPVGHGQPPASMDSSGPNGRSIDLKGSLL